MDLSSRIIVNPFKVQNVVDLSAEPTRFFAHHVLECEFSELDASTTLAEKGCKTRANHQRQGRTVIARGGRWVAGPHRPQTEAQRMLLQGVPKKID